MNLIRIIESLNKVSELSIFFIFHMIYDLFGSAPSL